MRMTTNNDKIILASTAVNVLTGNFLNKEESEAFIKRYLDDAIKIYPCVSYEEESKVEEYLTYLKRVLDFIRNLGSDYRFLSKVVEKIDKLDRH